MDLEIVLELVLCMYNTKLDWIELWSLYFLFFSFLLIFWVHNVS